MVQYIPCPRAAGGPGPCGASKRLVRNVTGCHICNSASRSAAIATVDYSEGGSTGQDRISDVDGLADQLAERHDVDVYAVQESLEIYLEQMTKEDGREIDPDDLSDDDVEFLEGAFAADMESDGEIEALNDLDGAMRDLDEADDDEEVWYARERRDAAIFKAVKNGARIGDVVDCAGLGRDEVDKIVATRRWR